MRATWASSPERPDAEANRFAVYALCELGHHCIMDASGTQLRCARGCAFGPVPSRRLGQSLGVNTVPYKTCTYSCVYCQLGSTEHLSVERRVYYSTDSVVGEVHNRLRSLAVKPDYVTLLGCGEPTLASNMGDILAGLSEVSDCRKALLTNGALLWMPEVRRDALGFDVVMPTVAAGSEKLFRRIHRPHPPLSNKRVLSGIRRFSEEFAGEIWAEVMLVGGVNDDRGSLEDIRRALRHIRAEKIHLTAPTRPPTENWVKCPTREAVELALSIISGASNTTEQETGDFGSRKETVVEDLLAMAAVHPMREEQVLDVLRGAGMSQDKAIDTLRQLVDGSRLMKTGHLGMVFYRTGR